MAKIPSPDSSPGSSADALEETLLDNSKRGFDEPAAAQDVGRIPSGGTDRTFDSSLWMGAVASNEYGPNSRQRRWMYVDSTGNLKVGFGANLGDPEGAVGCHIWHSPFVHKDEVTPVSVEMVMAEAARVLQMASEQGAENLVFEEITDLRLTELCTDAMIRGGVSQAINVLSTIGFLEETPPEITETWPLFVQIVAVDLMYFHTQDQFATFSDLEQAFLDRDWETARGEVASIYEKEPFRAYQMCHLLGEVIKWEEQRVTDAAPAGSTIN